MHVTTSLANQKLPNFYIAGTQKGGTTTLHHLLAAHERVYMPGFPQEIHYFDIESNYTKGLDWFVALFKEAPEHSIVGQTSPLYMYHPKVPVRIHQATPNAKFIFILRNPIARAYSHYWNSVRYGYEDLSFESALNAEQNRLTTGGSYSLRHHSYLDRGFYTKQIDRFKRVFGADALLILTQDELKRDVVSVQAKCAEFLNMNTDGYLDSDRQTTVHNPSKLPRNRKLQTLRPWLEQRSLTYLVRTLDKLNLSVSPYPELTEITRERLRNQYCNEIDILQASYLQSQDLKSIWR